MPSPGRPGPAPSCWDLPTGAAAGQQFPLALLHVAGAFGIAHPPCLLFEIIGRDAFLQVLLPVVERDQLFVRRAVVPEPIAAPSLAVVHHLHGGEPAGTVIVQIGLKWAV